jgi:hypothetical protein
VGVGQYGFFSNLTGFKNLSGCISLYHAKGFALLRGQKRVFCRVCFLFHSLGFCFAQSRKTLYSGCIAFFKSRINNLHDKIKACRMISTKWVEGEGCWVKGFG